MKKTEKTITKTLDEFEDEVSLYRLISGGQSKGLLLLRKIVDKIHSDNYSNPGTKLPSILLYGKEGTMLHAKAMLNSLCIEDIRECDARFFDNGINSKDIFEDSLSNTAHLITNIEQLRPQQESILWRFMKLGFCSYHNFALQSKEYIHCNGMVILTAKDIIRVPPPIASVVDIKIFIEPYTQEQLELIVHQRLRFCGINYNDDDVLKNVIEYCQGEIWRIIDLLKACILLVLTENQNKLTLKTVKKAAMLVP